MVEHAPRGIPLVVEKRWTDQRGLERIGNLQPAKQRTEGVGNLTGSRKTYSNNNATTSSVVRLGRFVTAALEHLARIGDEIAQRSVAPGLAPNECSSLAQDFGRQARGAAAPSTS